MMKMRRNAGFTLVEMLIVVAIIAILIAVSIPLVQSSLDKARVATDAANERAAKAAANIMYLNGECPNALTPNDAGTGYCGWYDAADGALKSFNNADGSAQSYGKCTGHKEGYIRVDIDKGTGAAEITWLHQHSTPMAGPHGLDASTI